MKDLDFATIRETVKNAYANGTGTFKEVAAAAGLEYIPAGKSQLTKRATPTIEANGRAYDFHAFLKACGVDIVKHERLTAGGERIPAQRLKVDKVNAAFDSFLARIKDITGVAPNDIERDKIDLNSIFKVAKATAQKIDKKEEAARAAAIEKAKVERKRKAAAAKVEKSSDEDKMYIAAAALGISVEELKALKMNIKPAKVNK